MEDDDVIYNHIAKQKAGGSVPTTTMVSVRCYVVYEDNTAHELIQNYNIPDDKAKRILPLMKECLDEIIIQLH